MDKMALNLRLAMPQDIKYLYENTELAQYRAANRFQLFFKTYRSHLVNWLEQLKNSDELCEPVLHL
ncbi:protein of unknown function [Legionella fallonii LLAP-10]|uniref:Uncharacterized protein n=1 Tax=Legionella fallonii LLAP-10 TaxID=1212491 RepID=A0A098G294_9GAMM|nr:protein of unknown function [Legionella fallonii LLAP-10]